MWWEWQRKESEEGNNFGGMCCILYSLNEEWREYECTGGNFLLGFKIFPILWAVDEINERNVYPQK